jgi:hypothetical protein
MQTHAEGGRLREVRDPYTLCSFFECFASSLGSTWSDFVDYFASHDCMRTGRLDKVGSPYAFLQISRSSESHFCSIYSPPKISANSAGTEDALRGRV